MTTTKDYAQLGKTDYLVSWYWDNGDQTYAAFGPSTRIDALSLAILWAHNTAPTTRPSDSGNWWVRIEKGTWIDASFDDDDYGFIHDAAYEPDPAFYQVGYLNDGSIDWDEG